MAEPISWEIREAAYDAYVTDGMPYDQVARVSGVSVSQLKRWGQEDKWGDARKEYRQALQSIRRDTVKLRAGLLKKALGSQDAQDIYAFAALERIEASRKTGTVAPAVPAMEKLREIKTPEDAVDALEEVVQLKLNRLLSQPETLQLSQVKDMKQCMDMVGQMRAKYARTDDGKKQTRGFDAEEMKRLQRMLEGDV